MDAVHGRVAPRSFSLRMITQESDAIAACKEGNLAAFDVLYEAYVRRIYVYLYRRTYDRQTAEDLTSITFLKALEKIGTYREGGSGFSAWLYTIARNTLTDHLRTSHPAAPIEHAWDVASDDDTTKKAAQSHDFARVQAALATLDPKKREILLLRLWDDLSYKEIAAITGQSEANCKMIVSRTLGTLKADLHPVLFLLLTLLPSLR